MPFNFVGKKKKIPKRFRAQWVKSDFTETESLRLLPLRCFQTIFCCSEPPHICVILSSSAQAPEAAGYHCCLAMRFVDKIENCAFCSLGGELFMFYCQNVTKDSKDVILHLSSGRELGENVSCRLIKVLNETVLTAVLMTLLVTTLGNHVSFELSVYFRPQVTFEVLLLRTGCSRHCYASILFVLEYFFIPTVFIFCFQ